MANDLIDVADILFCSVLLQTSAQATEESEARLEEFRAARGEAVYNFSDYSLSSVVLRACFYSIGSTAASTAFSQVGYMLLPAHTALVIYHLYDPL